jgi:hypothetical protein
VNTHAKLSWNLTIDLIKQSESVIRTQGVPVGMKNIVLEAKKHYMCKLNAAQEEAALESFVAYLLKNRYEPFGKGSFTLADICWWSGGHPPTDHHDQKEI